MKKAIIQAELNDILDLYFWDEISASKINELINDKAEKFAIDFAMFIQFNPELWIDNTREELLVMFKKQKSFDDLLINVKNKKL